MKLLVAIRAFALFAVVIMLSSSLAGAAETQIVQSDAQRRVDRLRVAVSDIRRGARGAVPGGSAALAHAPE